MLQLTIILVEGGGTIVISHNKNVKVSGITFKNQNGGHFLEITRCRECCY